MNLCIHQYPLNWYILKYFLMFHVVMFQKICVFFFFFSFCSKYEVFYVEKLSDFLLTLKKYEKSSTSVTINLVENWTVECFQITATVLIPLKIRWTTDSLKIAVLIFFFRIFILKLFFLILITDFLYVDRNKYKKIFFTYTFITTKLNKLLKDSCVRRKKNKKNFFWWYI